MYDLTGGRPFVKMEKNEASTLKNIPPDFSRGCFILYLPVCDFVYNR